MLPSVWQNGRVDFTRFEQRDDDDFAGMYKIIAGERVSEHLRPLIVYDAIESNKKEVDLEKRLLNWLRFVWRN